MLGIARINDIAQGICYCHRRRPIATSGIIISGSGVCIVDGMGAARIGDIVLANCGHTGTIITGSGVAFADYIGLARISDSVSGCFVATIVTGSGTTFSI